MLIFSVVCYVLLMGRPDTITQAAEIHFGAQLLTSYQSKPRAIQGESCIISVHMGPELAELSNTRLWPAYWRAKAVLREALTSAFEKRHNRKDRSRTIEE